MARLPPPLPPPVRHVAHVDVAEIDDAESLAKTVERKPARITTARFASVAPCAIDIGVPEERPASTSASSWSSWSVWSSSFSTALLRNPRIAIGAAVWTACVVAGITGVLLGHSRPSRAHAAVAVQTARAPRAAVVVEANEEITQLPILAPGKVIETPIESPVAETTAAAARPARRSGFGHLGADRVASGAAARRSAPHRR